MRGRCLGRLSRAARAAVLVALASRAAASEQPIRIGFFGPLSGKFSLDGIQSKRGADLAVREINASGGVAGRPLALVPYDDRNDRQEAVTIARRLAQGDRVVAALGSAHSLSLIAAAPVFNETRVPLLVTYASAYGIIHGNPYAFRWGQEADTEGYVLAHYAVREKGWRRLALLVQDEEYGRGVANGLERGLRDFGGALVYRKSFPAGEKEFRLYLADVRAAAPEAIVATGFGMTHVAILKQGRTLGLFPATPYLAPCAISEIDFLTLAGKDGEGVIGAMEFVSGGEAPATKDFMKRWTAAYGAAIPADHYAALNYESVHVLARAIRDGGPTPEGIRRGLAALKGFTALDGTTVSMTPAREVQRKLSIGRFDAERREFRLVERVEDESLTDPTRWAADYPDGR